MGKLLGYPLFWCFGHKLSCNDSNEMISISIENRLIEYHILEGSLGKIWLICSKKILQVYWVEINHN